MSDVKDEEADEEVGDDAPDNVDVETPVPWFKLPVAIPSAEDEDEGDGVFAPMFWELACRSSCDDGEWLRLNRRKLGGTKESRFLGLFDATSFNEAFINGELGVAPGDALRIMEPFGDMEEVDDAGDNGAAPKDPRWLWGDCGDVSSGCDDVEPIRSGSKNDFFFSGNAAIKFPGIAIDEDVEAKVALDENDCGMVAGKVVFGCSCCWLRFGGLLI
jgi:hypothetical protein